MENQILYEDDDNIIQTDCFGNLEFRTKHKELIETTKTMSREERVEFRKKWAGEIQNKIDSGEIVLIR